MFDDRDEAAHGADKVEAFICGVRTNGILAFKSVVR